jgi:hypothetical protein
MNLEGGEWKPMMRRRLQTFRRATVPVLFGLVPPGKRVRGNQAATAASEL